MSKPKVRRASKKSLGKQAVRQAVSCFIEPLERRVFLSASTVVTNLNDSGTGSLRQAILNAESNSGDQTVVFQSGLTGTITLTSGVLELTTAAEVTIQGPGANVISVNGNDEITQFTAFEVDSGATGSISGLTITNCYNSSGGGGINNLGDLTVANCTFSNDLAKNYGGGINNSNSASLIAINCTFSDDTGEISGGGISNDSDASLTVTGCTFSNDSTPESGGGIYSINGASLTVTSCTFSSDSAVYGGGIYNNSTASVADSTFSMDATTIGGGIDNDSDALLTVTGCTFSNDSTQYGGGINNSNNASLIAINCNFSDDGGETSGGGINNDSDASLTVTGCTFSNDSTPEGGGGIYSDADASMTVSNCTLTGDSANFGGAIYDSSRLTVINSTIFGNSADYGSDFYISEGTEATLYNTIVASNTEYDIYGTLDASLSPGQAPSSYNLIDSSVSGGLVNGVDGNIIGVSPGLEALADNGGPTQTMATLPGSPVIGFGSVALATAAGLTTDQRGAGYLRVVNNTVDIGAYQTQQFLSTVVTNLNDSGTGSLRQAILNAESNGGYQTVSFQPGLAGTITLTSGVLDLTASTNLIIQGPEANVISVNSEGFNSVFGVDGNATAAFSGLTITNINNGGSYASGVINFGTLSVANCTFSNDTALYGSAIDNHGMMSVANTTFSNDSAIGGGAIVNQGVLTIVNSTLTGDSASDGGAIENEALASLDITGSTFSNDTAEGLGGGIYDGGNLNVDNSTFYGNSADDAGGAIANSGDTMTAANCTFVDNFSNNPGGGISITEANVTLYNTIVAGNTIYGGAPNDITGTLDSSLATGQTPSSNNLIGSGGSGGLVNGVNGNIILSAGVSPGLGALANNGGTTQTMALLAGSPAINAGSVSLASAAGLTTDQRGTGFPRIVNDSVDIGAYQTQPPLVTTNPISQSIVAGNTATFTAAANGGPAPTVQWQISTNSGSSFSNISGATNTTYSFATTTGENGDEYQAVFTNIQGSATTSDATLTVLSAPKVTTNPTSQSIAAGSPVTFTAAASGNPTPTVQWYISTNSGSSFSVISGATSTTYSFTTTASQNGDEFEAVFTNSQSPSATTKAATLTVQPVAPVDEINAGGAAAAPYTADAYFSGGTESNFGSVAVNTSGVTNPAPQAVYDTERYGNFTYTIPVLAAGANYSVRLDFAELYWSAAGDRVFNVSINGTQVLTDFDIFKTAGGKDIAIAETFTATANNSGQIVISFVTVVNNAKVSGITITPAGPKPPVVTTNPASQSAAPGSSVTFTAAASGYPTPTVQWYISTNSGSSFSVINGATSTTYSFTTTASQNGDEFEAVFTNGQSPNATTSAATLTVQAVTSVDINAGGSAAAPYLADADFSGGTADSFGSVAVNTSGVANPAPQVVYDTERYGNFTYTVPGLKAGASYSVRLDFAELYWSSVGQRVFNVSINGTQVLTNFDIIKTAGAKDKAIAETFTATANGSGQIVITFVSIVDKAKISGIAITPVQTGPTTPVVTTNPTSQSIAAGSTVTFTAAANGNPTPTVQWQISTKGGSTFSNIGGATSTTYSFTAAMSETGYEYRAVFTNSQNSATTSAATLTVTPGAVAHLVFVQQPTNVVHGKAISPAVTVEATDAYGNVISGQTIHMTAFTGPVTGGNITAVTSASGIATFSGDLVLGITGTYTLEAYDGSITVVSNSFTVS